MILLGVGVSHAALINRGGGLIYDALGSYTLAWQIGVSLGLSAGIVQVAFALWRPPSQAIAVFR